MNIYICVGEKKKHKNTLLTLYNKLHYQDNNLRKFRFVFFCFNGLMIMFFSMIQDPKSMLK